MFGFAKKMFIGLLSPCKSTRLGVSLVSNLEGCIKCVSLKNRPCQAKTNTRWYKL